MWRPASQVPGKSGDYYKCDSQLVTHLVSQETGTECDDQLVRHLVSQAAGTWCGGRLVRHLVIKSILRSVVAS
jgi:hypothetical protein